MADFDEQGLRAAYDRMAGGDVDALGEFLADDYVLHMTSAGVTASGRDRALDLIRRTLQRMRVTELRADRAERHGDFVVLCVSGSSAQRGGPFSGVDVIRLDGDGRHAEAWVHRSPLPGGVDAAQVLEWED